MRGLNLYLLHFAEAFHSLFINRRKHEEATYSSTRFLAGSGQCSIRSKLLHIIFNYSINRYYAWFECNDRRRYRFFKRQQYLARQQWYLIR